MSRDHDSIRQYLEELNEGKKSSSFNEMADRIIAKHNLEETFSSLEKSGIRAQEIFPPPRLTDDEDIESIYGADFTFWKDDVALISLLTPDEPEGFFITHDMFKELYKILKDAQSAQEIAVTWLVGPDYPTIVLNMGQIRTELDRCSDEICMECGDLPPLEEAVKTFFEKHIKDKWDLSKIKADKRQDDIDILNEFYIAIDKKFQEVKSKPFKAPRKKKAADNITEKEIKRLRETFKDILRGDLDETALEKRLKEMVRT